MKKLSGLILGILLIVGMLSSGCKKEEETPKNHMIYDGVEYDLSQGVLDYWGQANEGSYNLDLVLLSSGFTLHEVGGEIDSLSGIGHGIVIELYSSSSTELVAGDYLWNSEGNGQVGTFEYADAVFNWNTQTDDGSDAIANGGQVNVSKNGDEYEIGLDLTMEGGKTLTGYFKGVLKYYDSDYARAMEEKKSLFIK